MGIISSDAPQKVPPLARNIDVKNSSANTSSKGIWASIKKVVNKYIGCLYPFNNQKNTPASTEHLNKQTHDKPLAAKNFEQRNNILIDSYKDLSAEDRLNYQRFIALGTAILSHKDYLGLNGHGVFRVSGNATAVNKKFKQISQLTPNTRKFSTASRLEFATLTSVCKLSASQLLKEANDISLSSNFEDRLHAIQNKEAINQQLTQYAIPEDRAKSILKNTNNRITQSLQDVGKPSLALLLVTRLCAEMTEHKNIHSMDANNLSIVFAPHLADAVKSSGNGLKQLHFQDELKLIEIS